MSKLNCTKTIDDYYINLEYGNDKKEVQTKISALAKEIEFSDADCFSDSFLKIASVMDKNLSLFKAINDDIDTVTVIVEYLNYFSYILGGNDYDLNDEYDEEYEKDDDIVLSIILTIMEICGYEMRLFLDEVFGNFIKKSKLKYLLENEESIDVRYKIGNQANEMILLRDSDLYAVIRYLKNKKSITSVNKIWVQEPIKEKLLWLVKEYLDYPLLIFTFRTKKELYNQFTTNTPNKLNILSIWTEDIVFAKNLAMSLNRDVLFINTYMDFYGGFVLLPYVKVFNKAHKWYDFHDSILESSELSEKSLVYNFFYNGMWQQPVIKGAYWLYNDSYWANATSDDVKKCINSAEKGYKIWSNKSITSRIQILSKFASMLERSGTDVLTAKWILRWMKISFVHENSLKSCSFRSGSGKLEVTKTRNPIGVIILKGELETILLLTLVQNLVAGNSVIVINSSKLAPYCNLFSVCNIPPGVVNLLSCKDINQLELSLCGMDYESYEKNFFSTNYMKTYINLTKPKQIILPLT